LTADRGALRRTVLRFGRAGLRPLPWRATRDPWAVLVSEVMLQQTPVARVLEPYGRFVGRFPSPAACAAAPRAEVIRGWEGLGYNRRALNLHRAATAIVERHGGAVPGDPDLLQALPGVGPYTARAVLAFAFENDAAVVDANVARVLARSLAGAPLAPARAQALADGLVPRGKGWLWNQSLMEIGALFCTARNPDCAACPLAVGCRWRRRGRRGPDPGAAPSRQGPFAGSDREARGRLVASLRRAPVPSREVARACGWPGDPKRARRIADTLVSEGLARRDRGGVLTLP
jgi:A/G-specific adenine glycosylase